MIAMFLAAGALDQARETAETFGFDWKIFFSQVISFVIVALVLRRFAYKPILGILEERRQQDLACRDSLSQERKIQECRKLMRPNGACWHLVDCVHMKCTCFSPVCVCARARLCVFMTLHP